MPDDVVVVKSNVGLDVDLSQVRIIWNNKQTNIAFNGTEWTLDLTVENVGETPIYVGNENDDYKSGVVVTLYDKKGELIRDLGYIYTNKTIFAGDSKRVILSLPRPEPGEYYLKIDFFCDYLEEGYSLRGFNAEDGWYSLTVH